MNVLLAGSILLLLSIGGWVALLLQMQRPEFWEFQIRKFDRRERSTPAKGGIVFTGSSSIKFWKTLERDMAPLRVIIVASVVPTSPTSLTTPGESSFRPRQTLSSSMPERTI